MPIRLTIEAETPAELHKQLLHYIRSSGPSERELKAAVFGGAATEAMVPTNDDYRRAIRAIPLGKVAPYSVVSEVVRGDAAGSQKVAGLAANDDTLGTAYRVVKKNGSIAAGFRWHDGRMGGPGEGRQVLEDEGVGFDLNGRVLTEFVLDAEQLRMAYEAAAH
jgi:alkylated DNA nucleotide flippase Atl1